MSNFLIPHLQDLMAETNIVPMVNQMEHHPRLQQPELQAFCREHQIQYEAWSPLMQGNFLKEPIFEQSAEEMALIDSLDTGKRTGPDPANFDF